MFSVCLVIHEDIHCKAEYICDVYFPLKECCYYALVDADFNTTSITITIPNGTTFYVIRNIFFIDDEINEIDQSFALVGVLGDDVPNDLACFQREINDPLCFGRTGGTTIRIEDNDGKALCPCQLVLGWESEGVDCNIVCYM